jgi:alpha-L-fucosidase 2
MGVTLKYLHGGHAPFQIDANMGYTAAVYEMIMYSDLDKIKLLPALPEEWKCGKAVNLHVRGGLHVSIEWNENEVVATISADYDKNVDIGAPCGYKLTSPVGKASKHGDNFVCLELKAGDTVKLTYVR